VANANPDTTIEVPPGDYLLPDELTLTGANTTIVATAPGANIRSESRRRVFNIHGNGTALVGITIRGASGPLVSLTDPGMGGAIDFHPTVPGSTLDVLGVDVMDGQAEYGGNIYQTGGTLYVADSNITGGSAIGGGGIYADSTSVTVLDGATVAHNTATGDNSGGGGLAAYRAQLTASNSSFYANTATGFGRGGAILLTASATLNLGNATLARDTAYDGAEIYVGDWHSTLSLVNSIIGVPQAGAAICNMSGSTVYHSNSLSADATCGLQAANGSKPDTDPKLLDAGAYGGPTYTVPPGPDSPAIDAANPTYCPSIDQRYAPRPQGGGCDIGAVESPFTAAGAGSGSSGSGGAAGGGAAGGGGGSAPTAAGAAAPGTEAAPIAAPTTPAPATTPTQGQSTNTPAATVKQTARKPRVSRLGRGGRLIVRGRLRADPRGAISITWTVRNRRRLFHGTALMRSGDRTLSKTVHLPKRLRGSRLVKVVAIYTDTSGHRHKQTL
jgi:hypothetical protein